MGVPPVLSGWASRPSHKNHQIVSYLILIPNSGITDYIKLCVIRTKFLIKVSVIKPLILEIRTIFNWLLQTNIALHGVFSYLALVFL
jgi:hypothetical protein